LMPQQMTSPVSDGLVYFGAGGDLALRMLFPSLAYLESSRLLPSDLPVIGVSRTVMDDDAFRRLVREALESRAPEAVASGAADQLLARTHYLPVDATKPEDIRRLGQKMAELGIQRPLYYLSVSPSLYCAICQSLLAAGLTGDHARVAMEKPIGKDLASSRIINDTVAASFNEDRVFRIDHYLGKETVQNLIALRFANSLFEPLWNNLTIDHVQITVAETQGVGERWPYYDEYGAMGDMVQNHMMQLLCLVAMEPPASDAANALRDEKLKVLRSLKPIANGDVGKMTVRGQYRNGSVDGQVVPSYQDELPDDRKGSRMETFVALKAEIENWRWAGVPFYFRTGKRLASRASEIVIQFRNIPHSMFDHAEGAPRPNRLIIRIQPDEGVKLLMMIKDPGPGGMRLREEPLNLSFAATFQERTPEAYERLLLDVIRGSQTLFMRRDELEAAWMWIDPIRRAWDAATDQPHLYHAGTWGPSAAVALIERDGRTWHEEN